MSDLCRLIWSAVFALFRSRVALHRNPIPSTAAQCAAAQIVKASSPQQQLIAWCLPGPIVWLLKCAGRAEDPQAGDGDPLASCWFPSLLALEITTARRAAGDATGDPTAHSQHE